jgi:hypothetical protein
MLTAFEGGILYHRVLSSSISLPHLRAIFLLENSVVSKLEQKNYNILYSEHLIYGLYMCTCVFLFHQEFFNMILVNNLSFYDGGVTREIDEKGQEISYYGIIQ